MREFLIAITGEWSSYIVGWSILFFFLFGFIYDIKMKKYLFIAEDKDSPITIYFLCGNVFLCPYIIYNGLYIIEIYILMFKYSIAISSMLVIIYVVYANIFFLSVCRLFFLQKYALYNINLYLLSFSLFTILMPICSFIICVFISGEQELLATISLDDILYNKNPSEYVQKIRSIGTIGDVVFNIVFIFPWLIYFYFSSTMKKLFAYIDREYDNFHEGENILPKWVLD